MNANWYHAAICVGYDSKGEPIVNAHNSDQTSSELDAECV